MNLFYASSLRETETFLIQQDAYKHRVVLNLQ